MNSNDSSVSHAPAIQSCSTHPIPMHMQFKVQNRALSNKVSSGKTKTVGILAEQSSGNSVSVINVNQTPKVYAPVPTVIPHKSNSIYHKSPRFTSSSQIKSSDNNLYLNVHFLRGKKHQNNRSDVLTNFQCKPDAQYSKQRKAKCLKRTNPSQKCNENKSAQYTSNQGVIMKCNTSSNKTVKSKTSKCSKKISSFNALGNSADTGGGGEDKHLNDDEDELIRDGAQALLNFATGGFSLDRLMPHQDWNSIPILNSVDEYCKYYLNTFHLSQCGKLLFPLSEFDSIQVKDTSVCLNKTSTVFCCFVVVLLSVIRWQCSIPFGRLSI